MSDTPNFKVLNTEINMDNTLFSIRGDLDGTKTGKEDFLDTQQFIGLIVGEEEFLLPIGVMNEIIMISHMTFVPRGPKYVEGVINLRGKILPALNLRQIMGLETTPPTPMSRIIIVSNDDDTMGLLVDGITYVVSLSPEQLEDRSLTLKGTSIELVNRISKRGNKVNGIMDISKVLQEVQKENDEKAD
tara:strand:+ start:267 stop:830 length:564 start_codon:yes stop_codon:yes gene_type:complete